MSFEQWRIGKLHHPFGLTRHYQGFDLLDTWMASQPTISEEDRRRLEELQEDLIYNADLWNEDGLGFFFISHLIRICCLKSKHDKMFTQRSISAVLHEIKLSDMVDFVIAQGMTNPTVHFSFCTSTNKRRSEATIRWRRFCLPCLLHNFSISHSFPCMAAMYKGGFGSWWT